MQNQNVALIDIGSSSVRLLIAYTMGGELQPVYMGRFITRLGDSSEGEKILTKRAIKSTVEALENFKEHIAHNNVGKVICVATSAVREAHNRDKLISRAKDMDIHIEVISGKEEASITGLATLHGLKLYNQDFILFDIGGGSTEFSSFQKGEMKQTISLPYGSIKLCSKFNFVDTVKKQTLDELFAYIDSVLEKPIKKIKERDSLLIGNAGTVGTIDNIIRGEINYGYKNRGQILKKDEIRQLLYELADMPATERLKTFKGLLVGKEDLIIAGTALVWSIMEHLEKDTLTFSPYGLKEGLILSL